MRTRRRLDVDVALGCLMFACGLTALALVHCYKGDPGYGGDYPPEPPFVETVADAGDASRAR